MHKFILNLLFAFGVLSHAQAQVEGRNVKFYIHTSRNREQPQLITADVESLLRSSYFALDPTIISLPRWQGTKDSPEHQAVINAQLAQRNCNVIVIDWSANADLTAATAADEIAELIVLLEVHFDAKVSTVHTIGFSEGAHIAGLVGQQVQQKLSGAKIGRITALDPSKTPAGSAGESVQYLLTANDAAFVEVIHTNAGSFGIDTPVGHVDYYPNGGSVQPNCLIDDTETDLCAHERAYELVHEMWSPANDFISALCDSTESMSAKTCRWSRVRMGQNSEQHGVYYLETNGVEPYSKGSFYIAFL